jgi:hypothetical protein
VESLATLRLKDIVRKYWIILFVAWGILFTFSSYQINLSYTNPSFEDKNITVSSYTQYGTYSYSTIASKQSPLYLKGTVLDMNESAYYFATSPIPKFSFVYRINASDSAKITATPKVSIIAMCKKKDNRDDKVLWQREFPVTPTSSTGPFIVKNIDGSDDFTYKFTFNAAAIENNIENTYNKLDYSPKHSNTFYTSDMAYEIKTLVAYNGIINGKQVENTTSFVLPMTITRSYYELSNNVSTNITNYNNETVNVQNPFTVETVKYPLASMLLSVIAIIGIVYCRATYNPNPVNMAKLEQERMHSLFREFISEGKIPENRNSLMSIEIASLQELINAAVDMNERVIYDSSANIHFTIHNGVLYYFTKINHINETKSEDISGRLSHNKATIFTTSLIEPAFKDH